MREDLHGNLDDIALARINCFEPKKTSAKLLQELFGGVRLDAFLERHCGPAVGVEGGTGCRLRIHC